MQRKPNSGLFNLAILRSVAATRRRAAWQEGSEVLPIHRDAAIAAIGN
jgi:hypothetical protein